MVKLERHLYVPDVHRPYHDKRAWKLFMQVAKEFKPDTIVSIGDFGDFYSVSSHSKALNRDRKLKWEVASVNEGLDELDTLGASRKIFIEGNHCLSPEHRALTQTGWKYHYELSVGEKVATRDSNGCLEWQAIEHIIFRPVEIEEKFFTYSTVGLSVKCTDQHNIIGHSNKTYWKRPAKEAPDTFDLLTSVKSGQEDYYLSDVEIELAAWGSTDVHYNKDYSQVTFYQSEGKDHLIRECLNKAKFGFREVKRVRDIKVIAGKTLKKPCKPNFEFHLNAVEGQRLRDLTQLSSKGDLPPWVNRLSDRQADIFLKTLIAADGSVQIHSGTAYMFYGKESICQQVQRLAVTHGWNASIVEYRPTHFRVNLTQRYKCRVQNWRSSQEKAFGDVWCLTVKNGNFLTERHGRVHVTGNCDRLRRYLQDKAPELFEVVDIPSLLNLNTRHWEYIPYRKHIKIGKVYFTHDVGASGRNAAFRALDKYKHGVVTGHTHKINYIVEGNLAGDTQLSVILGWLGDATQIDYVQEAKAIRDSALGFGVGYRNLSNDHIYITPVPIVKYSCVVEGKLYTA